MFKKITKFFKSFYEFKTLRSEMLGLRNELATSRISKERITEIDARLDTIYERLDVLLIYIRRVSPKVQLVVIFINVILTATIIKLSWDFYWDSNAVITNSFYQVTAQIIPVFLIAILIETRNGWISKWSFLSDLIGLYLPCFAILILSLLAVAADLKTSQLMFPILVSLVYMFANILLSIYFSIDDRKTSLS